MQDIKYILITAARDEEEYIEKTIQSVVSQTVLPQKWIIVSDGSTDRTVTIVQKYVSQYSWIELIRIPGHKDRQFASKANAFNAGLLKVKDTEYEVIGNLDADISFENNYFEFILGKFTEISELGVAGTPFMEEDSFHYDYRFANIEHVSGYCQLFRRSCFEEIGGYAPVERGGIDWIAVTTARMKGWKTQIFKGKISYHHRKIGTSDGNILNAWFKQGCKDYSLGSHPLWHILRSFYQIKNKPYLLGGVLLFLGYTWSSLCRIERPVSDELMKFYRNEQIQRLKRILKIK
ncbi:MAG: glycosyltransferase family 2 protein [Candidatus Omnitrophica bacterium]|nr:glycosyltransferase family 2 protein [Candidatus Omnitrophota bacterium]